MSTIKTTVTITNKMGFHARPAMAFVDLAGTFDASIKVIKDGQEVDGKSIMHLMMLAATQGTQLEIIADGNDAQQAIDKLTDLVDRKFDEE